MSKIDGVFLSLCKIRRGSSIFAPFETKAVPKGPEPAVGRLQKKRDKREKPAGEFFWEAGRVPGSIRAKEHVILPSRLVVPAVWNGETVTQLDSDAFADHSELRAITLPEGITRLGDYCFWKCTRLQEVQLPASLREVGEFAFGFCEGLTEIRLPEGLRELGNDAFFDCENLRRVRLPSTLKVIHDRAFLMCRGLLEIQVPEGLVEIGAHSFLSCDSLRRIVLPRSWKGRELGLFKAGLPRDCQIEYR